MEKRNEEKDRVAYSLQEIFLIQLFQNSPATLEIVGINTGKAIIEKVLKDKSRVSEPLEMIKVICKDFWVFLYEKQMDNLKTNHRGVFVLSDNNFKGISKFSCKSTAATLEKQATFLLFPCGLIKGALENMGINASVTADVMPGNAVTFSIRI
jgi:hypothetical protein